MPRNRIVPSILFSAGLSAAIAVGGCSRQESTPVSDVQTQTAQPANQPVTIAGCLKRGDAADTFVLTAARTGGSTETATYQLVGAPDVNLQDHVGHRIEVNGTIEAQQEIASRTTAVPADGERPTGTSGEARVETKTEIDIKRVSVSAVKPLGDACEM
jgi:hypothetical protein